MNTITITFEDNIVTVTDGRQTSRNNFNKITYEPKQALIALAEFYGYEPAELLCFDEGFEDDDDNDFLQDLLDEATAEETINIWLDMLLESTGKSNVDELTAEEIRAEIEEVEGTIQNEEITLGLPNSFAEENIKTLVKYLSTLTTILMNKEEEM